MHTSTVVIGAGRVGRTVAARLVGARLAGRGATPDLAGCRLLLIATPVVRVGVSIFAFIYQGDRLYTLITATVFCLLLMSFVLGKVE